MILFLISRYLAMITLNVRIKVVEKIFLVCTLIRQNRHLVELENGPRMTLWPLNAKPQTIKQLAAPVKATKSTIWFMWIQPSQRQCLIWWAYLKRQIQKNLVFWPHSIMKNPKIYIFSVIIPKAKYGKFLPSCLRHQWE